MSFQAGWCLSTAVPGPGRTGMRVCFVVNNVRTQKATYTTLCLAFAGHRRGHDVAFASVDAFSQGEGPEIIADVVRPKPGRFRDTAAYARALTSSSASPEDARLPDFDVAFLRTNPNARPIHADPSNPPPAFARPPTP